MKLLFTSPLIEHPAAGGPQLRIENSIKALSSISDLIVVSRRAACTMGGKGAVDFYSTICQRFIFAPSVEELSSNRYIRKLQEIFRRRMCNTLDLDAEFLVNLARENDIDVVWFGYGNISYPLIKAVKRLNPSLKVVCDTDSVWSRFVLRALPFENDPKQIAKIRAEGEAKIREEEEWVNLCDITTAVSDVDARYYADLAMDKSKVMLFSNVIDVETYKNIPPAPQGFKRPCIYLAGTFGPKSPMDKAARWFIEAIYPLVKKEIPHIHFYIVGSGSKQTLADIHDESISIMGKMPSVLPYLCHADVALVPLQFESGTRFKIMEAAACRIPIVSTTLGAEGIPVEHEKNILIADTAQNFSSSVLRLIKDKPFARELADNCHALIVKNNSIDSLAEEAKKVLKKLEKC